MCTVGANIISIWRAIGFCILLVLCAGLLPVVSYRLTSTPVPNTPTVNTPTPYPTATASPPPSTPTPWVNTPTAIVDLSVHVVDVHGANIEPLREVVIRVSDSSYVDTGEDGQLKVATCHSNQFIFAWAPGYEINSIPCSQSAAPTIVLNRLEATDNPNYQWRTASGDCVSCHGSSAIVNPGTGATFDELNEWFRSGHAKVFQSGYFISIYRGTNLRGQPSVPARPVIIGNEWVPVPPEMNQDYRGPGYRLDFPQQPGNCAFCHAPGAIQSSQSAPNLDNPHPGGAAEEGVTCDVCHKVFDVILDDNGFPFIDRPGILSLQLMRPTNGVFMTGPFANLIRTGLSVPANHRSSCAPIFSRSEFCAACHFGKFGDMVIYNSYGEWKASPYAANPADPGYRTCQDCHMSHIKDGEVASLPSQRQACSASDVRFQDFNHNVMDFGMDAATGKEIPRMVKKAADITVNFGAQPNGTNTLDVNVSVTNTRAGHNFPTDSPLRHLILVVRAQDRASTPLIQVGGSQIPRWAGASPGTPTSDQDLLRKAGVENYGGQPGKVFVNLLVEEATNLSPSVAYWNETKYALANSSNGITSDNRLRPHVSDISTYSFAMPDSGNVKVTVELIYRYAFYDLMVQKEWFDRADIVVTMVECSGPPRQLDILVQSCKQIEL